MIFAIRWHCESAIWCQAPNNKSQKYSTKRLTFYRDPQILNQMVEQNIQLDAVFGALSDPTRRQMLFALRDGELSVGQLAEPFEMSLAGAAKHVQVLERSNLIVRRKQGRTYFCSINDEAFVAAQQWFLQYSEFWNTRLDTLTTLLQQEREKSDE